MPVTVENAIGVDVLNQPTVIIQKDGIDFRDLRKAAISAGISNGGGLLRQIEPGTLHGYDLGIDKNGNEFCRATLSGRINDSSGTTFYEFVEVIHRVGDPPLVSHDLSTPIVIDFDPAVAEARFAVVVGAIGEDVCSVSFSALYEAAGQ